MNNLRLTTHLKSHMAGHHSIFVTKVIFFYLNVSNEFQMKVFGYGKEELCLNI